MGVLDRLKLGRKGGPPKGPTLSATSASIDRLKSSTAFAVAGVLALLSVSCSGPEGTKAMDSSGSAVTGPSSRPAVWPARGSEQNNETPETVSKYGTPAISLDEQGHLYLTLLNFSGNVPAKVIVSGASFNGQRQNVGERVFQTITPDGSGEIKGQLTAAPLPTGAKDFCGLMNVYDNEGKLVDSVPLSRGLEYGNPTDGDCPKGIQDGLRKQLTAALVSKSD